MITWIDERILEYKFGYRKSLFAQLEKEGIKKCFFVLTPNETLYRDFVPKTVVSVGEIARGCKNYGIRPIYVFSMDYDDNRILCIPKSYDALIRLLVHFGEKVPNCYADSILFNKAVLENYRDDYLIGTSHRGFDFMLSHTMSFSERELFYKEHPERIKFKIPYSMRFIKKYDFYYSQHLNIVGYDKDCYLRSRLNGYPYLFLGKVNFRDTGLILGEDSKESYEFNRKMDEYCQGYSVEFIMNNVEEYSADNVINDVKNEW